MTIQELGDKRVCILGYGREGKAMLHALRIYAPTAHICIADSAPNVDLPEDVEARLGSAWLTDLDSFDVLVKSPGIPPNDALAAVASKVTNSTQIALDTLHDAGCRVVGVTGTKGKSTTASLIHAMLIQAAKPSVLVGNIGEPIIAHLEDGRPDTVFIVEMSSYQLAHCTVSPHIAVITSFFPEHLDYHGSIEAYMDAKQHITRFQTADDIVFFRGDDAGAAAIAAESPGRLIPFLAEDCPDELESRLIGQHNRANLAAACMVSALLGVEKDVMIAAAKSFRGLPHRLESIGILGGFEWIDDAISTTPDSTAAALDALGGRVHALIVGGKDRGVPMQPLAKRLRDSSVQRVVLFGENAPHIRKAMEEEGVAAMAHDATSMEEAVRLAVAIPRGDTDTAITPVILLSPAAAGYDRYKNFEEKGTAFRRVIERLFPPSEEKEETAIAPASWQE